MRKTVLGSVVSIGALAAMAASAHAGQSVPPPGDWIFTGLNQPGQAFSRAWDVNNAGVVALESGAGAGGTRAYRWAGGAFDLLGTLGGNVQTVRAINESGQIAGNAYGPGGLFDQQAFVWSEGAGMVQIPRPAAPHSVNNFGRAINDAGVVIGNSNRAWSWTESTGVTLLSAINGGPTTNAQGINNNGWIVGSSQDQNGATRATLWRPGESPLNLGVLDTISSPTSVAFDVNNNGVVVGYSGDPLGFSHAFVWTESGGMVDLGAPGMRSSFANAVNDNGWIVGFASFADAPQQRAYLWVGGEAFDLNDFVDPSSGWVLNEAYGINDLGWIVVAAR